MTFKNKAILAGCTVGFSVVLAIVSLVSIFAVSSVSNKNKTNVKITYTSTLVSATYSFCYKNADEENYTYLNKDVSIASKAEDGPTWTTDSISNTEIHLSKNSPYFILCWVFKNTGSVAMQTNLSRTPVSGSSNNGYATNFGVTYINKDGTYKPENMKDENITRTDTSYGGSPWTGSSGIGVGYTYFFFIKITMNSKYVNVNLNYDYNWTLSRYT